jgi:hypothetical protein
MAGNWNFCSEEAREVVGGFFGLEVKRRDVDTSAQSRTHGTAEA